MPPTCGRLPRGGVTTRCAPTTTTKCPRTSPSNWWRRRKRIENSRPPGAKPGPEPKDRMPAPPALRVSRDRRSGVGRGSRHETAGAFDVASDLEAQLVEGSEALHRANALDEGEFEAMPVDVPAEVEQVDFDERLLLPEGGAAPDVGDGGVLLPVDDRMSSVHALRRQHLAGGGQQIGGWEAKLAAPLRAADHLASQLVVSSQQVRGLADVAVRQQPANPRAANGASPVDDRLHHLHHEAVRAPERGECFDGARALTAERKIRPDPDFDQRVARAKRRDEVLRGHPSDGLGERPDVGLGHAERLHEAGTLLDGTEGERRAFRTKYPLGVGVE